MKAMEANSPKERLLNGIIKENPTFVLMLGMCPTLAITTSAFNGIGMGLTTTVILAGSNLIISLLRNFIPDRVRMPSYIVVVASFVTIVQLLLQGFIPALYSALGIYIPLIVVNCIILGRAEAYASKHEPKAALFDGIGMGLGFTLSITCIGIIREILGSGKIFGFQLLPLADAASGKAGFEPITIFILAPGAFFVLAALSALQNRLKIGAAKRGIDPSNPDECGGGCASCGRMSCSDRSEPQTIPSQAGVKAAAVEQGASEKVVSKAVAEKPEVAAAEEAVKKAEAAVDEAAKKAETSAAKGAVKEAEKAVKEAEAAVEEAVKISEKPAEPAEPIKAEEPEKAAVPVMAAEAEKAAVPVMAAEAEKAAEPKKPAKAAEPKKTAKAAKPAKAAKEERGTDAE